MGLNVLVQHPRLARVGEDAAGFYDRSHLAQRFELRILRRGAVVQDSGCCIEAYLVAGEVFLADPIEALKGEEIAAVDGIAEENPRINLGDDRLDTGRVERDGRVLARRAA